MARAAIRYASDLPRTADLAVVGGGIAGCATAFFAARAGLDVVVLERRPRLGTLTTAAATGAFTIRQKLVFPELPEVPPDAPMTIEDETGAHWRPALRGCFALWTDNAAAPTAPADPVATTPSFAFGLLDPASDHALARLTPFWREVWERGNDSWYLQAGQYEYTPDHRPFIGPTPIDDLHLNTGYSGHGVMASAGGARRLVDLLLGRDDPDANPFRLGRPLVEHAGDVL